MTSRAERGILLVGAAACGLVAALVVFNQFGAGIGGMTASVEQDPAVAGNSGRSGYAEAQQPSETGTGAAQRAPKPTFFPYGRAEDLSRPGSDVGPAIDSGAEGEMSGPDSIARDYAQRPRPLDAPTDSPGFDEAEIEAYRERFREIREELMDVREARQDD